MRNIRDAYMNKIYTPNVITLSMQTNKTNGIKVFKANDRMFDAIVERAYRTTLFNRSG